MIKFKGCPKCQGDLYLNQDMYGNYFNCLQCGYTKDVTGDSELEVREPATAGNIGQKKVA